MNGQIFGVVDDPENTKVNHYNKKDKTRILQTLTTDLYNLFKYSKEG